MYIITSVVAGPHMETKLTRRTQASARVMEDNLLRKRKTDDSPLQDCDCMRSSILSLFYVLLVVVMYARTHTNHQTGVIECKHLPLPKSVTDKVLASGVYGE